jgi:hypothetical protein
MATSGACGARTLHLSAEPAASGAGAGQDECPGLHRGSVELPAPLNRSGGERGEEVGTMNVGEYSSRRRREARTETLTMTPEATP